MPVISEVDTENGVIFRKVKGTLTFKDVEDAIRITYRLTDFKPGMGAVWDYSQGTLGQLNQDDLSRLAKMIGDWIETSGRGGYRVAAYAPDDIDYGLSRVCDFFLQMHHVPLEFSVFRKLEQAMRWAHTPNPKKAYSLREA